ncbi:hypothetical protein [Enterococcus sp. HY326]|uniref:hypothetical protein n=1 Tax=Enterococcus sp. HY326 TaxID=2971265 RepID=UPI00223F6B74|nr:hypothetical protein [Enterococcus sp. HY326]
MNERERQNKAVEKAAVRNSEYNRMSINATRLANPGMPATNLLPGEVPVAGSSVMLILNVVAVVLAIALFGLITLGARFILPEDIYGGVLFLAISLIISVAIAYFSRFPLWRIWRKIRRK